MIAALPSSRPFPATLALTLALCMGACGDDVPAEGDASANTTQDIGAPDLGESVDAGALPDTSGEDIQQDGGADAPDVSAVDDVPTTELPKADCPGGSGCECDGHIDCDQGFCIEGAEGKQCAKTCVDKCEPGYNCVSVTSGGGDAINICAPAYDWLCDPCSASSACQKVGLSGAACVDYGAIGAFCGVPCSDDGACPTDYACEEALTIEGGKAQQCVRKDVGGGQGTCTCSQAAAKAKLATSCWIEAKNEAGEVVGKCAGSRFCGVDGLSACDGPPPAAEVCDGVDNDCNGAVDEETCDDDNPCTTDACDATASKCTFTALADGVSCDDGSACTQSETCAGSKCVGKALNCDDGNACTSNTCDVLTGCKVSPVDAAACDDDNPCTVGDACASGSCQPGAAKVCKTDELCLVAKCSPVSGKCTFLEVDAPCNDGNACTQADACKQGFCLGKAVDCDDKNACTSDVCDNAKGCASVPNASPCDDGDVCTSSDGCAGGKCVGLPKDVTVDCGDGKPCTTDGCDPVKGCVHAHASGPCDDGNVCTVGDLCDTGECKSGANTCDCKSAADCAAKEDGDLCNGTLFCNTSVAPYKCQVNVATVISCAKGDDTDCLQSTCDGKTGKCALQPAADDKPCDADGNLCTMADACKGGSCAAGAGTACDDGDPCTVDSCDGKTGQCVTKAAADGASCVDGDACTTGDACAGGKCAAGKPTACDDDNACTTDGCDKLKGCTHLPDLVAQLPCYGGKDGTKGVGVCVGGLAKCKPDGTPGPCEGEVVPTASELCNGKDDTCDGKTDTGCAAADLSVGFGGVRMDETAGSYRLRLRAAGDGVAGPTGGDGKVVATWGLDRWIRQVLGL